MSSYRKPIVVVGTGRCGSTLFHRLLARHGDVGWLSTWNETFPTQTWLSAASNLYRLPLPHGLRHQSFFPKPYEAYLFWERFLPGFSTRGHALTADHVPQAGIEPVRRTVAEILRFQRRTRFLFKITARSRLFYLDRVFPDALFIHIRREPRAVISSWIKAGWLDVTSAPDSPTWQWPEVPPEYLEAWRDLGGGPLLSAAVKVKQDVDEIEEDFRLVPERSLEIHYEDLIARPEETLRRVLGFAELDWTPSWDRVVRGLDLYDPSNKWKDHFSEADGDRIVEFFARAQAAREGWRDRDPVAAA